MATIGMKRQTQLGYDEVLARLPELLKSEGFGVLTEIDVQDTLKKKIGADFRRYKILGACNPHFAHEALSNDLSLGVMLPCNVAVYESDDGRTVVSTVDPRQAMSTHDSSAVVALAEKVRAKLAAVLERLG